MGVTAAPASLVARLRTAADGDLRELARDSLVGIHPDQNELREWADLMDEAADALSAQAGIAEERTELTRISAEALELVRTHAVEAMTAEAARDTALARVERLEKALGDAAADFDSIANSADPFDDAVGTQDHGLLLAVEKMAGAAGEKVRSALSEAPPQGEQ